MIVRRMRTPSRRAERFDCARHPVRLVGGNLDDAELAARGLDVQQRLHFEARAVDVEFRQTRSPERVVAVAEVGVLHAPEPVHQGAERAVADASEPRDVGRAAAHREACALGEIGAGTQRGDEPRDLRRIGGAVGIEHHDDVAVGRREAAREGVALSVPVLLQHDHVVTPRLWPSRTCHRWSHRR